MLLVPESPAVAVAAAAAAVAAAVVAGRRGHRAVSGR